MQGGYRSGRRYEAKERVEQCITLSLSWMLQNDYLDLGVGHTKYPAITWSNYRYEPTYQLTAELERLSQYEMRLYLRNTGQVVYLHPTSLHFGGVRWWFGCPGCGRRCATLPSSGISHPLVCCRTSQIDLVLNDRSFSDRR